MKKIATVLFCILFTSMTLSQQEYEEVVYLKNGSVIKGIIIEQIPDVSLKIQTKDGNIFVYQMEEIDRITKESVQPTVQTDDVITDGFAQHKKVELYIGGGLSFPMSEGFSDMWSMGFSAGGGVGYRFGSNISGNANLSYSSFPIDEDKFLAGAPSGVEISGGSVSVVLVTANLKVLLIANPQEVSPYLIGGIGLFSLSVSDVTVSYLGTTVTANTSASESALGIVFGGGVDIPVSPSLKIFLEAGYVMGFTEGDSTEYLPLKGGIIFLL